MPQNQGIEEVTHTCKKTLSYYRAAIQIWKLLYGELTFHAEKKWMLICPYMAIYGHAAW